MDISKFRYKIKKFFLYYLAGSFAAGGAFYVYTQKTAQQYTASAMIEYKTDDGNAPDGTKIDTNEITGSEIITKACESIHDLQDADLVRQGISIEPIVDDKEEALYEAKLEHGEEYEIVTKQYLVSFTSDISKGRDFSRKVLNAVLQQYCVYYGTHHSSVSLAVNNIDDISYRGYDYMETMDAINESLDNAMALLSHRIDQNGTYRAASTGYSFQDLYEEFSYIRNIESPKISAEILHDRVSRDAENLITVYRKKNEDLKTNNVVDQDKLAKIKKIIDNYVAMMQESGNAKTEMDDKTLQEVFDTHGVDTWNSKADKTSEYDHLLDNYIQAKVNCDYNDIEYSYNQYVIDSFSKTEKTPANVQKRVESEIETLLQHANRMFTLFNETNEEYNEYLGAQNVAMLTNVSVAEKMNVKQYTVIVMTAVFMIEILMTAVGIRLHELVAAEEGQGNAAKNSGSRA